ncbi:uncharacterized protein APUU_50480A [Aspergillus puulaauensis]|uniref:DUF3824 domain-containing protein n=1 Tax=Aspergillus puulaauensis TaxID=1220207 RepID=A0A7R7XS35_9EURO|nr:uncharacterized protein APUU_50480A [Aspergillus puulaauensis]BCS25769.1 hypothetical protein APUU_50480A [Aspergillus puulaauensis]
MAYYDSRPPYSPHDRYPPPEYSEAPYHYGGSHSTEVMPHGAGPAGGTRDSYYRNHPARDAYEYGYGDYPRDSKRSRKGRHRAHSASGRYDDPYDNYEPHSRRSRHHDERRGRDKYAYSPSTSRSPPRRRRSLSERALGAVGLGGAAAATGSKHRDSDRGRSRGRHHRSYSYSPSPTRRGHGTRDKNEARIAQAVKAAVTAGAVEAFRARKEPGDWSGPKGKRVLTAALAAGGTDGLVDKNPDSHSKRHFIESTLAGLATNRLVNGSRSRSRSRHGRHSGSGSKSHGGKTKDAALMGLLATAGKEAYDRYQKSHDRSRPRDRSDSRDGYDSYDSRPRPKKRSKSVSDYISKGIAALGLDEKSDKDRSDRSDRDDRRRRHHRSSRYNDYSDDDRYSDDDYYRRHPSPPRARHSKDVSRPYYIPTSGARSDDGYDRSVVAPYPRPGSRSANYEPQHDSREKKCSDAKDSIDDPKKLKKLNKETLWATGIAAAATIHAAHSLTENMEKHKERSKQLKEGEISKDQARHRRRKNQLSDVASVGVAALSIQSAVQDWRHFDAKRRERASVHKACKERSKSLSKGHSNSNSKHHSGHSSSSRPQRAQSLSHRPPRTVYPDEIEENWSVPDRSRYSVSGARSPGVLV